MESSHTLIWHLDVLMNFLFSFSTQLKNWAVCFLFIKFWEALMYLGKNSFIWYMLCKYFLLVCRLSFHSLNNLFEEEKFLILMKPNLSIFYFVAYCFGVISKNPLPSFAWFWALKQWYHSESILLNLQFSFKIVFFHSSFIFIAV